MGHSKRVLSIIFMFIVCVARSEFQEIEEASGSHFRHSKKPVLYKYDEMDFQINARSHVHIVLFHKSKCDSCKDIAAFLEELTETLEDRPNTESIVVATIDCDSAAPSLCKEMDFKELPTLAIFKKEVTPFAKFSGYDTIHSQIKNFIHDDEQFLINREKSGSDHNEAAALLDHSSFNEYISNGRHFIKFYTPWCADCQQLAPTWEELRKSFNYNSFTSISKVDCTVSTRTCDDYKITTYPTLVYFKDGQQIARYHGQRDYTSLKKFIASMKPHHSLKFLIESTSENFNKTVSEGATVVRFYDDECPNCQNTVAGWHYLVDDVINGEYPIKMAEINCRKNEAKCFEQYVYTVPTIVYYMDSVRVDLFRGSHSSLADLRLFLSHLKDKKPYELPPPELNYVTQLSAKSFSHFVASNKFVFVKFYVPWCEFCKSLAPIWNQLALKMYGRDDIVIAEVNCSEQNSICRKNKIIGYPTMLLFSDGQMTDMYTGVHDVTSLRQYLLSMAKINHRKDEL